MYIEQVRIKDIENITLLMQNCTSGGFFFLKFNYYMLGVTFCADINWFFNSKNSLNLPIKKYVIPKTTKVIRNKMDFLVIPYFRNLGASNTL